MAALPRPPVWVAVLIAPAAVDAAAIVLTVALALSLGREPNLETTFVLVPIPMARMLLGLADSYALTGSKRTWAVFAGIVASIGWWIVALAAAAWVAALATA
jgi:hypothetical protein